MEKIQQSKTFQVARMGRHLARSIIYSEGSEESGHLVGYIRKGLRKEQGRQAYLERRNRLAALCGISTTDFAGIVDNNIGFVVYNQRPRSENEYFIMRHPSGWFHD